MTEKNDELLRYLTAYCHSNALGPNWLEELKTFLQTTKKPEAAKAFKSQLRDAILRGTLSLDDFESTIAWDIETEQEMTDWLLRLWGQLYDSEHVENDG